MVRIIFILFLLLTTSCSAAWWNFFGSSGFSSPTAVEFNGTDESIEFANTVAKQGNGNPFSVCGWIKAASWGTNDGIIGDLESDNKGFDVRIANTDGLIILYVGDGQLSYAYSATNLSTGAWHHFCATYDGSGNGSGITLYINNSESTQGATGTANSNLTNTHTMHIGRIVYGGTPFYFDGRLQDLALIPKKLNSTEVSEVYNNGSLFDYTSASFWTSTMKSDSRSLLFTWENDDLESANGVVDLTDNGYTGTGTNLTNSTDLVTDAP